MIVAEILDTLASIKVFLVIQPLIKLYNQLNDFVDHLYFIKRYNSCH